MRTFTRISRTQSIVWWQRKHTMIHKTRLHGDRQPLPGHARFIKLTFFGLSGALETYESLSGGLCRRVSSSPNTYHVYSPLPLLLELEYNGRTTESCELTLQDASILCRVIQTETTLNTGDHPSLPRIEAHIYGSTRLRKKPGLK